MMPANDKTSRTAHYDESIQTIYTYTTQQHTDDTTGTGTIVVGLMIPYSEKPHPHAPNTVAFWLLQLPFVAVDGNASQESCQPIMRQHKIQGKPAVSESRSLGTTAAASQRVDLPATPENILSRVAFACAPRHINAPNVHQNDARSMRERGYVVYRSCAHRLEPAHTERE